MRYTIHDAMVVCEEIVDEALERLRYDTSATINITEFGEAFLTNRAEPYECAVYQQTIRTDGDKILLGTPTMCEGLVVVSREELLADMREWFSDFVEDTGYLPVFEEVK